MAGRPMKYPYTFLAKVAQFPYQFQFKTNWLYRYYLYGIVASAPFFLWVTSIVNSPEAKAKYREEQKRKAAAHHDH